MMSKKNTGTSNKKATETNQVTDCGKRKKITRKDKVAASKSAGIIPDYTPKKKVAAIEKVLSGTPAEIAKVILEGSHFGLVRLHDVDYDVTFRVTTEEMHGLDFVVVYIHEAKSGVLAGLSGNKTFVTKGQLHASYFKSKLTASTENYGIQMKMFHFLQSIFYKVGLLTVATKKVEQSTAPVIEKSAKANRFIESQNAYAIAEKKAVPMFMDEIPGEYNLFGNILRVGPHPIHNIGSYLELVRSGGELGKIKQTVIVAFHKFVFGKPETDNLSESKTKADTAKVLAFLREKLAKEIAFKHAEKTELDEMKAERKAYFAKKATVAPSQVQDGKAVASQHHPSKQVSTTNFKPVPFEEHLENAVKHPTV